MFLAPAILAGLLAIGLPLWLHRVARANPARHAFASLMLLEPSEVQRTAQRTLRYWALLILRILLLLAVVLAFAGPLLPRRAVPVVNPDARLHAIVMDTSFSMQYGDRWQQSLAQARQIIDAARPGDQLLLVDAGGHRIQVLQHAVNARQSQELRAALDRMHPGSERLDYGLLMSTASGWLGTAQLPVELHLVTDLQQSAGPLRFADLEPPPGARLVFHETAQGSLANTYIESAARTAGGQLAVEVRTTSTELQKREAIIVLDGNEVTRRPFQIGPARVVAQPGEGEGGPPQDLLTLAASSAEVSAAQARVLLPLPQLSASAHRVEVRLEPVDALPLDDRYFAVLEHSDPRVLVVSRNSAADDAVYAAAAVGSLDAPRLLTEQVRGQDIEGRPLQNYAAIIITDVAALSSAAAANVSDYARAGGALLITLGPGAAGHESGLLPDLRIRNIVSQPTQIAHVDTSHPVLRDAAGWQDIHFLRYLQVTPANDDRVLISLQQGAPLLIERQIGAGRALVLTAPLEREWNDFATHPLFVRFMAEAAAYLTDAEATATRARVGATVMTGLTAAQGGQIFDPQGRRVLNLNQTATAERLIPDQAGFYEIRNAGGTRWLAVNTDVRESNLARMTPVALQRWQDLQQVNVSAGATGERSAASPSPTPDYVPAGYGILLLALLLAIAEIVSANHFLAVRREVPHR